MVQHACSNGNAICKFSSHLRPVEFFTCNKVSPLTSRTPILTSVSCASKKNQLRKLSGAQIKHEKKVVKPIRKLCMFERFWNFENFVERQHFKLLHNDYRIYYIIHIIHVGTELESATSIQLQMHSMSQFLQILSSDGLLYYILNLYPAYVNICIM